jgi:leader peptidase (prepilin peptidase)/N-methyltransferase
MLRGKSLPFAFGPYLAIAGWLCLLYGEQLTKVFQALMTA